MAQRVKHTRKDADVIHQPKGFQVHAGNETGYDHSSTAPILLEQIMDQIVWYATKSKIDSYYLLRHFQFTREEIEGYFNRLGKHIHD